MPRPLSPTKLANHLACPHATQLDRLVAEGRKDIPFALDPRLEALLVRGQRFELEYVETLRDRGVVDLTGVTDVERTREAMRAGAGAIVQAPLGDGVFTGRADVLLRVDTPSGLGAWSYEVVDTKLARETKAGTILQLLTYCEQLDALQGRMPERFYVRTPREHEKYRTADFAAFHRAVKRDLLSAATAEPAPITYPEPVEHCSICGYWQHCERQRRADDHPSLIANATRAHVRELQRQGLATLAAVAEARGELPHEPQRGRRETFARIGTQAELQLRRRTAPEQPVPFEVLTPDPALGLGRLPAPSDGDLFLDFEGDPFVGDGGREYLTGWLLANGRYEHRWGRDAAGEKAAVEAFLDAVAAARSAHGGMRVYHFAAYEPAALKRVTQRYDTRVALLDELLREGRFVDLRTVVREAIRAGIEGYGLKDLEELFGFERRTPLLDAGRARRRLEIALELEENDDDSDCEVVRAYNEEDCRATRALRDWLWARRREHEAKGVQFAVPQLGAPEAKEKAAERVARIAAIADALRQGLDLDRTKWSDDQKPHGLLADLAGYFQREDKCQYWEHYRLRELPEEDWLDEREMLAGLEFVRDLPLPPRAKAPRQLFSFPPQETGIDDEDLFTPALLDPLDPTGWGTGVGKVLAIDHAQREVAIQRTTESATFLPRAVFRRQDVGTLALEGALLAFAEHVLAHGLDDHSAWGPARDLLCRRPPRLADGATGALRRPGEAAADALVRLCLALDRSTLPLQGPPGTGKSHSGALAILELLRHGKRVGVTAVSHKVIDNLLLKVRDLAAKEGRSVGLVHKDKGEGPDGIQYISDAAKALAALDDGALVGGTAWLWVSDAARDSVDFLFVDEAGQMALPAVLAASRSAKNLVLLGDPMQLEQPRRGAHPEGSDRAALVHLLDEDQQVLRPEQGLFLDETWRMHPELGAFTSELYYEGKLQSRAACSGQRLDGTDGFDGAGLWLCEVPHEGNQARSDEEVDAVVGLCERLLRAGATWTDRDGAVRSLTADDVLVVAPYNVQVGALARALAPSGVTRVGTVDRFQGQEAPVVIYSCTSSSAADAPRGMSFLYDPHRFNVATSRAKCCVVVVASPALLEPECRTVEHLRMANGLCRFAELARRVDTSA